MSSSRETGVQGKALPGPVLAALAGLLSMVVYLGSLDGDFVYDDLIYIVNNPQIKAPGDFFVTPYPAYLGTQRGLYRPMTTASLALDYWIYPGGEAGEPEPWGFHFSNMLLHGLCTLVLFLLLRELLGGRWAPFLGALLIGLHPARSEAVAWAVGRAELLAALGSLSALLLYLRYIKTRSPLCIMGALAAFALGALSKENALALPGILLAYEILIQRGDSLRLKVLRIAPFLAALVMILALRYLVLGTLSPQGGERVLPKVVFPERLHFACWVLSRYVALSVFPLHLAPHYRPLAFFEAGFAEYLPAILLIAFSVAALLFARRFAFAAALFLVPLVTVLNLIPIGEAVAERFLYLPLAGMGLAFGLAVQRMAGGKKAIAASAIAAGILIFMGFLTVRQVEVWTDHYSLWSHAVSVDPDDPQAHYGLGAALLKKGILEGEPSALSELEAARKLNPNYKPEQVDLSLGRTYELLGKPGKALDHYGKAIQRIPIFIAALEAALDLDQSLADGDPHRLPGEIRNAYLDRLLSLAPDEEKRAAYSRRYGAR